MVLALFSDFVQVLGIHIWLRRGTAMSAIPHLTLKEQTFTMYFYVQSYRPESLILENCIAPR